MTVFTEMNEQQYYVQAARRVVKLEKEKRHHLALSARLKLLRDFVVDFATVPNDLDEAARAHLIALMLVSALDL